MYSRSISRYIWNFSRHLINFCLLISGFLADPSSFSAEKGSSSKHCSEIYPVCKGYVLFSFEVFSLWENHEKGRKNVNSTRIFGHSTSVCDNFSTSTNCKDRRKYADRFTRETTTRTVESIGGGGDQCISLEHYKCPLIQSLDRTHNTVSNVKREESGLNERVTHVGNEKCAHLFLWEM
jgi:hypothetical protein